MLVTIVLLSLLYLNVELSDQLLSWVIITIVDFPATYIYMPFVLIC